MEIGKARFWREKVKVMFDSIVIPSIGRDPS
jgi:hypothetical protein